jgi:hypothetical protein
MSERPWWAPVVQWGLWAVIMALVMGYLARRRSAPRPQEDEGKLVHPASTLVLGLVCGGFFLSIAVLCLLFPGKTGSPALSLFFIGFALLGVPLLLDYRNARHTLLADGMQFGRMLGGKGVLRWSAVRRLRYSQSAKWFRIDLADGGVVRVSAMLMGLPGFARAALSQVSATAIDSETRTVLEATAAGTLPRIWG